MISAQQRNYAMKRITEIEQQKIEGINRKKFETDQFIFDAEKRLKLFKAGKFKLKEGISNPFNSYREVRDAFIIEGEREAHFDREGYNKAVNSIKDKATYIRDQLMLGDAASALKMITDFEK